MTEQPISGVPMVPGIHVDAEPPETPAPEQQPGTPTFVEPEKDDEGDTDWQAKAMTAEADVIKWRNEAKKWEQRAKDERRDDKVKRTLEERISTSEQQMTELQDQYRARSEKLALQQIRTDIAKAGINPDDVEDLLATVDPARFLDPKGDPDDKAISTYSSSLTRFAGRIPPDPDQGKTGGTPKQNDMNSLIRRAAGRTR